jgi:arylsulfatase A-like enzyme
VETGPVVRRALCLLLVGAAAKLVLVALRASDGAAAGLASAWALPAMLYQEVWAALALATVDLGLARIGAPRAGWALYAAAALYVAGNVPIARQFGTPLTWAFVEAAGGALWDSIVAYATPGNLSATALVIAAAAIVPRVIVRPPQRLAGLAGALALLLVLGPIAVRRCETLGLHRNALAALATTWWARVSAGAGPIGQAQRVAAEGPALDLSHLAGAARGRDVVWVLLESTGARYLPMYAGREEWPQPAGAPGSGDMSDPTPRLSALARRAVIFESAYTSYPESIKSLYALLCGRAPAPNTGAADYDAQRSQCEALPELLRAAGYRTGLFHSGRFVYLGMRHLIDGRGFEALHDAQTIGGKYAVSFGTDDASTAERVLQWIDEERERPFFALYMPIAGHHPYRSPGPDEPRGAGDSEFAHYLADLGRGDEALGRLIDGLAARGRLDNVLWVIQGDHGEAFHQHAGNFAHSLFVYEENVHVPLIVAPPGAFAEPVRAPQVAGAIDVAPTIAAMLGVQAPASWEGRSLLRPEPGVARFFSDYSSVTLGLRTGNLKCLVEPELGRVRVFDLAADPGETRDVRESLAGWAEQCAADLQTWAAERRARVRAEG